MGGFLPGFLLAFTMILMMIVTSVILPRTAPMDDEVRRLYRAWFNGLGIRRYTDEQGEELRREQATEIALSDPVERAAYRRGRSTLSYGEATSEWLRMIKEATVGLLAIVPVLIIIMVVLGSIYTGWATPTEAAALGVFGALVVAIANELFKKPLGVYADWGAASRGIRDYAPGRHHIDGTHILDDYADRHGCVHAELRVRPSWVYPRIFPSGLRA